VNDLISSSTDIHHSPSEVEKFPARPIRAEANLLRFPVFALTTKGLKNLDGIECSGRISRDDQTHQFRFRATRNTATRYPGPLARAVHIAFLSIITEAGLPTKQPLTWTWGELCRHMRISCSGCMVERLKAAILSTAGIVLWSESALYTKATGQRICTQEEGLHLYDRVVFRGTELPDGHCAESNGLWLSPWYRENLNALFTAPLDYSLWLYLNERSTIASRLYEFLLLNFYNPIPVVRINYETLTNFLPIHPEKYLSAAQRQIQTALTLLQDLHIIKSVEWSPARRGLAQLTFSRGSILQGATRDGAALPTGSVESLPDDMTVREIRNTHPPEWHLVREFHRLWSGNVFVKPTPKDLITARELLDQYGRTKLSTLLPLAIKKMKVEWPDAKTIGAVARYLPEVTAEHERRQRLEERRKLEDAKQQQESEDAARQAKERAALKLLWESMAPEEQRKIREKVLEGQPKRLLRDHPELVEKWCLMEFGCRRLQAPPTAVVD